MTAMLRKVSKDLFQSWKRKAEDGLLCEEDHYRPLVVAYYCPDGPIEANRLYLQDELVVILGCMLPAKDVKDHGKTPNYPVWLHFAVHNVAICDVTPAQPLQLVVDEHSLIDVINGFTSPDEDEEVQEVVWTKVAAPTVQAPAAGTISTRQDGKFTILLFNGQPLARLLAGTADVLLGNGQAKANQVLAVVDPEAHYYRAAGNSSPQPRYRHAAPAWVLYQLGFHLLRSFELLTRRERLANWLSTDEAIGNMQAEHSIPELYCLLSKQEAGEVFQGLAEAGFRGTGLETAIRDALKKGIEIKSQHTGVFLGHTADTLRFHTEDGADVIQPYPWVDQDKIGVRVQPLRATDSPVKKGDPILHIRLSVNNLSAVMAAGDDELLQLIADRVFFDHQINGRIRVNKTWLPPTFRPRSNFQFELGFSQFSIERGIAVAGLHKFKFENWVRGPYDFTPISVPNGWFQYRESPRVATPAAFSGAMVEV